MNANAIRVVRHVLLTFEISCSDASVKALWEMLTDSAKESFQTHHITDKITYYKFPPFKLEN